MSYRTMVYSIFINIQSLTDSKTYYAFPLCYTVEYFNFISVNLWVSEHVYWLNYTFPFSMFYSFWLLNQWIYEHPKLSCHILTDLILWCPAAEKTDTHGLITATLPYWIVSLIIYKTLLFILGVNSIWGCIQNSADWVDNEIYAYKNKHSLRSNTNGYGGKTH
jgi:hypothetical protein